MSMVPLFRLLLISALPVLMGSCGVTRSEPVEQRVVEWFPIDWSGGTVNVAVLPPQEVGAGGHPVVFALPWGSGSGSLVMGFLEAYWGWEPGNRGYYVVAPEVTGSTLADIADELIPAIFAFMDDRMPYDPDQVALVGASNGGRGIFHTALSQPDRFQALVGLPGMYEGDPQNLAVLEGKPVWLLVGELDQSWVEGTQSTADALTALGIDVTVDVEEGQDHVLVLDPVRLMDWIDSALGR